MGRDFERSCVFLRNKHVCAKIDGESKVIFELIQQVKTVEYGKIIYDILIEFSK